MADNESSSKDPVEVWRKLWSPWLTMAPQSLTQPINTGWTFGNIMVTGQNSTAPDAEQLILAAHSYGRQIGRIMDAVSLLIEATGADKKKPLDPRAKEFIELAGEIKTIKDKAKTLRLDRLRGDLETLKRDDPGAFKALKKTLDAP